MKRLTVSMTDRQHERLHAQAQRLGISVAELLRRILDDWVEKADPPVS